MLEVLILLDAIAYYQDLYFYIFLCLVNSQTPSTPIGIYLLDTLANICVLYELVRFQEKSDLVKEQTSGLQKN